MMVFYKGDGLIQNDYLGQGLHPGDLHYRPYIGPPERYGIVSAMTFNLLTKIGLRQYHRLLDIGCGSLRIGRLLIPYLNRGNYVGLEPNEWVVRQGIENEVGNDLIRIKRQTFFYTADFNVREDIEGFHYMVAQSIFSHAALSDIRECLSLANKKLRPEGILLANFKRGDKDYDGAEWVYPGCVSYTLDTIDTMREVSAANGLSVKILDCDSPSDLTWAVFYKPQFDVSVFSSL